MHEKEKMIICCPPFSNARWKGKGKKNARSIKTKEDEL